MKAALAIALALSATLAQAEVTRIDCPPSVFSGARQCYSLGNLDESQLGIALTGSSCAKSNPRNTAPSYFQDTYYFSLTKLANLSLDLQPKTSGRLRVAIYTPTVAIYTPTIELEDISALLNGTFPNYTLTQLEPANYSITVKGTGTGVGAGVCGYRATFNTDILE